MKLAMFLVVFAMGVCTLAMAGLVSNSIDPAQIQEKIPEESIVAYRPKLSNELEADDEQEYAFDEDTFKTCGRPSTGLTYDKVKELAVKNEAQLKKESNGRSFSDVERLYYSTEALLRSRTTPYFGFASYVSWKPKVEPCCLKKWKYQCVHVNHRMPCFYDHSSRHWCCPIWPYVTTARCACNECPVYTSTCIVKGRCVRRYTRKSFLAVCYSFFPYLKIFWNKPVPTSCYCRAKSVFPYLPTADQCLANKG